MNLNNDSSKIEESFTVQKLSADGRRGWDKNENPVEEERAIIFALFLAIAIGDVADSHCFLFVAKLILIDDVKQLNKKRFNIKAVQYRSASSGSHVSSLKLKKQKIIFIRRNRKKRNTANQGAIRPRINV